MATKEDTAEYLTKGLKVSEQPIIHEKCKLCSEKSERFCNECQMYLCDVCHRQHNNFPILQLHHVIDRTNMTPVNLVETCGRHHVIIDMFCEEHDIVLCHSCWTSEHSSCQTNYLPNVATWEKNDPVVGNVKRQMKGLKRELEKIRETRRVELSSPDVVQEIQEFRKKIEKVPEKVLIEMEKKSLIQVQNRHKDQIEADIDQLNSMIQTLNQKIKVLESDNKRSIFINVKENKKVIEQGQLVSKTCSQTVGREAVKYSINKELEQQDSFGQFWYKEIDVKVKNDQALCRITGSCQLIDGSFILADFENNKLKKLNKSYELVEYMPILGNPYAVCQTDKQEVAVSLWGTKTIQFVSIHQKMTPTTAFTVGEKCRGLAFMGYKQLLVATGGDNGEGPGQVRVYEISGTLTQTIQTDFSIPRHVAINFNGTKIYIANRNKGILVLNHQFNANRNKGNAHRNKAIQVQNHQFKVTANFTDPALTNPFSICIGENNCLFVSGSKSNNVVMFDQFGACLGEVLNSGDGLKDAYSVCYDKNCYRLLVTMDYCNTIKFYDLK